MGFSFLSAVEAEKAFILILSFLSPDSSNPTSLSEVATFPPTFQWTLINQFWQQILTCK